MSTVNVSACAGILLSFIACNAMADVSGIYGKGLVGGSQIQANDIDNTDKNPDPAANLNAPYKTSLNNDSWAYGGSIGYQYNGFIAPIRIEGEYIYRGNYSYHSTPILVNGTDTLESNIYTQTITGNLIVDIPITEMFQFFIGGGGGLANTRTSTMKITPPAGLNGTLVDHNKTDRDGVSWMATAGMSVIPVQWLAFELSYRYTDLGSIRWEASVDTELTSNNLYANEVYFGIRLNAPTTKKTKPTHNQATQYNPPAVKEQAYPIEPPVNTSSERSRRQKAEGNVSGDK